MNILMTSPYDIPYDDLKDYYLKDNLLYVYLKGRLNPTILPNGKVRKAQFDQLRDIHRLHSFLQKNTISHTVAADSIGTSNSTISNLFRNNTMSKDLKEKLAKQYPGVFDVKGGDEE